MAAHIGTPLQFATASDTPESSYSAPFTSGVAAGRLLVCSIARSYTSGGEIPLTGISDDAGNTWRYVARRANGTGISAIVIGYVAVCYVTNPISPGDELHVTFQAPTGRCAIVVEAFDATPADPAAPVKAFAAAHVTSAQSTVAAAPVSFTPPALVVCCIAGDGQTNQLATVGSGWQALTRVGTAQPTSAYRFTQQMWTEAGSSPQTATGTFTANTVHVSITIAIPTAVVEGSGQAVLPAYAGEGAGAALIEGVGESALPAIAASGAGTVYTPGFGEATFAAFVADGAGDVLVIGSGEATVPALVAAGYGFQIEAPHRAGSEQTVLRRRGFSTTALRS